MSGTPYCSNNKLRNIIGANKQNIKECVMTPTYKCSWCGRTFTKKGLIGGTSDGAFLNKVGLKKDYCSTACKTAAQQAGGASGGASGGGGGAAARALGLDQDTKDKNEARRQAEEQKRANLHQTVAGTTYSSEPAEIVSTMQQTAARFNEYEKGTDNFEDFAKGIQQKLDEGVYLLRKNTEGEDDYYLQQGEKIKADFDSMVLKKRRKKKSFLLYFLIALTIFIMAYVFDYYFFMPVIGLILGAGLGVGEFILGRKLINKIIK